ncbi:hypothetical protein BC939DRAFT_446970 [Gamsiella multidivaricata]|uniref:uncharacterized protein n=1 Tax=Gamsiella multidivaricata TaxID=101098 RepID=UPI0022202300|nr:uncharacterized protein BC939DRAFT_446970 [Gamsiella multidivaricata]KAI7826114.1 hypothetical protein BC939DRAFT_446970 [Gamsiella multidivaricata]
MDRALLQPSNCVCGIFFFLVSANAMGWSNKKKWRISTLPAPSLVCRGPISALDMSICLYMYNKTEEERPSFFFFFFFC